jgi:23S rRNA pseudouridine1911/1915/1917 synthase
MNSGYTWREVLPSPVGSPGATRLLDHLTGRWRHGSALAWRDRIARGEVTLDGEPTFEDAPLVAGQELVWRRPPWREPEVPLSFALLHHDDHLLAVAKPAGLPTMPSGGRFLEHTLLHQVRRRWPAASPLHRLDRGTSGVVLFATSDEARRAAARAWQTGAVRRLYLGLVAGRVRADRLAIRVPIGERPHPTLGRVFVAADEGRPSTTHVRVLDRRGEGAAARTLVEIEIESGRPHQIRIHLAFAGHPLVGEPFFASGGGWRDDPQVRPGDPGYRLHAWRLSLPHPVTGQGMEIECPPPSDLRRSPPSEAGAEEPAA